MRVAEEVRAIGHHWACLDASERQRSLRYRHNIDRVRYIVSRGTLRAIIGRKLGIEPSQVKFWKGKFGKPFIAGYEKLQFNTSHSGSVVLHGLSREVPVGVDVEVFQQSSQVDLELFNHVLTLQERDKLLAMPASRLASALIELWVCKEAYVKAIGQGLSRNMQHICISSPDGSVYKLLWDRNSGGFGDEWNFHMIDLGPAHAGCVAYAGRPRGFQIRHFGLDVLLSTPD